MCVRKYEDREAWAIFIFNTTEESIHYSYSIRELIGAGQVQCYSWKPQHINSLGQKETLEGDLKPHHSALYYLSLKEDKPHPNLGLNGEVLMYE